MRIRATAAMAAVLLCAAISNSAQAVPPGMAHSYGAGGSSCGEWLAERKGTNAFAFPLWQWVLGWVSAADGYKVRGDLRDTDSQAIAAWVDKYCAEHPLDNLTDAAGHLVVELSTPK